MVNSADSSHVGQYLKTLLGRPSAELQQALKARTKLVPLPSGTMLFSQGDTADCTYLVLRGRLQVTAEIPGQPARVINEVPRGQSVGEMAMFTRDDRSATVRAIRDSLLLQLDHKDFEALAEQFPEFALAISRQIIGRLSRSFRREPARLNAALNLTVLPRTADVDLDSFTDKLCSALKNFGSVLYLRAEATPADHRSNLAGWLDDQETHYQFIVLQGDPAHASWTNKAVQHADKLLLVGQGNMPTQTALLPAYLAENRIVERHWVFSHEAGVRYPTDTVTAAGDHLVHAIHHVSAGDKAHIARLARILSGNSHALVLAGGGARGMAHIGVFQALERAGIPIDRVGGTSIGAAVGALIAAGMHGDELARVCRQALVDDEPLSDYTLPLAALLRGRKMDYACRTYFPADSIEDLWLPFFCVSADLAADMTVVHERGVLWKALRASMSLPGIFPPVVDGKQLLVDGAMVNNLPVDIMAARGDGKIIAVDLEASEMIFQLSTERFPGTLTQLRQRLLHKLGLAGGLPETPSVLDIVTKAALISSEQKRLENRQLADVYLNPSLAEFSLLNFHDFDQIVQAGYDYTMRRLEAADSGLEGMMDRGVQNL